MQCPTCGTELRQASRCDKCGENIPPARNGLEVEYKEFPVSELLEIRHRPQPEHERADNGSPQDTGRSVAGRGAGAYPRKWRKTAANGVLIILIALMIIIAVLLLTDAAP